MERRTVLLLLCTLLHTAVSQDFKLFVTDSQGKIYVLNETGTVVDTITNDAQVVGVAVDPFEWHQHGVVSILYSTLQNGTGNILRRNLVDNSSEVIKDVQVEEYAAHAPRLTVDKTSGNIYFVRVLDGFPGFSSISVQTPSGTELSIVSELDQPRAIAVHSGGLLFWCDIGTSPYIGSAGMDGSGARKLIDSGLSKPTGIAVDDYEGRLYWIDTGLQTIERCDLDGLGRETILFSANSEASDLVVDNGYIYYSSNNEITKVKITDTSQSSTFATLSNAAALDGMAIFSSHFLQYINLNPCSHRNGLGDCSSICLPNTVGYSCSCDGEGDLLDDSLTCDNAVFCPNLTSNGQLQPWCNRKKYEYCEIICDNGFQQGPTLVFCGSTGNWEQNPCKYAMLGASCSSNETVCADPYSVCDRETLTCRCLKSFTDTDGDPSNIGGTCIKFCQSFSPPTHGYLSRGYSSLEYLPDDYWTYSVTENIEGSSIDVYCDTNYTLFGNSYFVCLRGGVWDIDILPECIKDCEIPEEITFGTVRHTGLYNGSSAAYHCQRGYKLNGKFLRTCNHGIWNESTPSCEPVDCGAFDMPHGRVIGGTRFNEIPVVECDVGYIYNGAWCGENGVWDISISCYPQTCFVSDFEWYNWNLNFEGVSSFFTDDFFIYGNDYLFFGESIHFGCNFGYELVGPQEITCQANGAFSGQHPYCSMKDCPSLSYPDNGYLSDINTFVGIHVTVSCLNGFMYFGDTTLVCLLGGTWTGTVGTCIDTCPKGTYITEVNDIARCLHCPRGEYQPMTNQSSCTMCEQGFTTAKEGTFLENKCFADCAPGHGISYGATQSCKPCAVGRYNDKTGENPNNCKECPNGLTTNTTGQTSCTLEGAVTEAYMIKVSLELLYEVITDCSQQELEGIRADIETAIDELLVKQSVQYLGLCDTGKCDEYVTLGNCVTSKKRETSKVIEVHVELQNVSNSVEDTNDYGNHLPSEDVLGEIFSINDEALSPSTGGLIQAHFIQLADQPSVILLCNPGYIIAGSVCVPCGPGTFWINQTVPCVACPMDTYQNEFGQTECKLCPGNTYNDGTGAAEISVCLSFCQVNEHYCNNRGVCLETGRRVAECSCNKGYEGAYCEKDINECLNENGGCQNECNNFEGGYSCTCLEGYINDLKDPTKCRVDFFPFGEESNDSSLTDQIYSCTEAITPPVKISIRGTKHEAIYACTNGFVSFDDPYFSGTPSDVEHISDRSILAPYFVDMEFSGLPGALYHNSYDKSSSLFSSISQRIKLYVKDMMNNEKQFDIKYIFVATWFQARRYPSDWWWWNYDYLESEEMRPGNVTFQLVLASSRKDTFALYIYGDGLMNLGKSPWSGEFEKPRLMIGYTVKGGLFSHMEYFSFTDIALDIDQYAETSGIKGTLMYHLTPSKLIPTSPDTEALCLDWYDDLKAQETSWEVFTACPCNKQMMWWDPWFMLFDDYITVDTGYEDIECFDSRESWQLSPNAVRCCYDKVTGGWVSDSKKAGGLIYYHPQSYPTSYQKYDVQMKQYCCIHSENCDKFRELRPVGICYNSFPWELGSLFGDPHFTTLDDKSYTFNGWGEYVLLQINTDDVFFDLQCRTERATTDNGTITDATIFSAFSARDFSNASLHVELSYDKKGMNIFGNGVELTLPFKDHSTRFLYPDPNLVLTRQNESLSAFFVATGINVKISLGIKLLTQEVTVPKVYEGAIKGLLGNFDGDPENDFIFRNGTKIKGNSTDRDIFWFGKSWMITEDESAFIYQTGQSHQNFSHPDFVPIFLDEFDPELVENATKLCGEGRLECIFDKVVTGSDLIAAESGYTAVQHADTLKITHNMIPSISGTRRLEINLGDTIYTPVYAHDDGDVSFTLSGGIYATLINITGSSAVIEIRTSTPIEETPSVVATDVFGVTSASFVFEFIICTGCSGHGICSFQEPKVRTNTSDNVKFAKCICDGGSLPYWSGDDCEMDFNGCSYRPCSWGRNCIDYNATDHMMNGVAFFCTPCPDGYQQIAENCLDKDECLENNTACEQSCVNTEGSFYCTCHSGYRLNLQNGPSCEDINECDEALHSCQHICINTRGSYNCSCYDGYNLSNDSISCEQVEDVCSAANIDCTATAGCRLENGGAQCFCNTGFQLSESGTECINKNECLENVCAQTCTDTEGSYKCGCLPGYSLLSDGTSCTECDGSHWGLNCANVCTCGRGATSCDKSTGCQCTQGWTGLSCDKDINECARNASVCGDINMICSNTIGSYLCRCRDGFQLGPNNTCEDINECDDMALNECQHTCSNVIGSFTCGCNAGYITDPTNPFKCIDLDECLAGIADCEQICINVPGSFNCDCHFGYILNDNRKTCEAVSDEDLCAVFAGMNCTHLCIVENMRFRCSCPRGYNIAADNQTCTDIKECEDLNLNICSEPDTCVDYDGGYSCSCPIGAKLENDGRTCLTCDSFHYGVNCEKRCDCKIGADHCDPVSGCICQPGWFGDHCEFDKDECSSTPCAGENKVCLNNPGSYECACDTGFELDSDMECVDIDECMSTELNTCDQICNNTEGRFTCQCNSGFIFVDGRCKDIDECQGPNDCQQECTNTLGGYRCKCNSGYKLDLTDRRSCIAEVECSATNVTLCQRQNADCILLDGQPDCQCRKGYEKNSSGICSDIKECEQNPCSHICVEEDGGYSCLCNKGFKLQSDGKTCLPCQEGTYGMECSQMCLCNMKNTLSCNATTGICSCKRGYKGLYCNEDVNECLDERFVCPENSDCLNTVGSYICKCRAGYFKTSSGICLECENGKWGMDCQDNCSCNEIHTERCDPFCGQCLCQNGWAGVTCDNDVDECLTEANICETSTEKCENTLGSFRCVCKDGYVRRDNGCQDKDECIDGTALCTQDCINTNGSYQCRCFRGYKLYGTSCIACELNRWGSECQNECLCIPEHTKTCNASNGHCECQDGWSGIFCETDVNECDREDVCGLDIELCQNTNGSYRCYCKGGFGRQESGVCSDIDECLTGQANCSQDCVNTLGSYECHCYTGYKMDQRKCIDIDECTENTSLCSHECFNTNGSYECRCPTGFKTRGFTCTACEPNKWGSECQNECLCIPDHTKTCNASCGECECQDGWSGTFCETDVNECDLDGVCGLDTELCENTNGSYRCFCIEGFGRQDSGDCSDIDECLTGQANCSQDCINILGSFECQCFTGFKMEQGQCIDIDECTENTSLCSHECINIDGSYECRCTAGLKLIGFTCTECTTGTWGEGCRNNCTCVPENTISCRADTGDCDCWGGWTGKSCESDINECMNDNICDVTTEVCENKNGSYRCACKEGFGRHEDLGCTDIDECFLGLVECAQVCVNTIGSYHCRCQPGYRSEGNNCTDINECDEGTARCPQECINTEGSYNCNCSSGYANTNFSCEECDPGKWGPECQEDCECVPEHTEQCNSKTGGCQCRQGWTGLTCEDDINECATANACDSITEDCTNNEGSYTCICKPGLGKYGSECIDIDECQVGLANCSQECINTHGSYQCKCRPGFAIWDSSCKECDEGRWGDECQGECTCVLENTESCNATTGHCHCNSDWFGDTCSDECLTDNDCNATTEYCANEMGSQICACKNNFRRVNGVCQINCLVGTYTDTADGSPVCRPCPKGKYQNASNQDSCLKCDPGYTTQETGNIAKENCSECEPGQWGDNCLYDCLCVSDNTELCSHVDSNCQCKVGWNGSRCELDVNECLSDNTCDPKTEICENINGSYKCNCKEGLGRFNDVCRDIDECLEGLAGCSQECINTPGSYYCKCRPGFTTNGSECTDCDEGKWGDECQEDCSCDPDNSELCDSSGGHCECKDGWTGQLCETDVNECSIENNCDPLKEDCENTNGSYQCKCKQGYRRVVDICEVDCPKGTYINNTNPSVVCLACPQGEYQELVNQDSCVICDQDYTTVSTGSIMKEQCVPDCPPGEGITYGASKDCQPCDVGKYNDKSGANPNLCKECPLGFTTESAGQKSCGVPVTVTPEYQTRVTLPLVYEVETDCSAESLRNIIESLLPVIKLLLMKFDDQYSGLCGVDMKSCDEIDVTVGDCSSLKRASTHSIALNVTISGVPNYVQDANDDSRLPVETVLAEIFESNPTDVSSEENAIQYAGLGAEPRSTAICETGTEMIDGVCRCTNNTYGDNCLFKCDCDVENTISPTQSCDSVTGVCLCLPTWGGQKCTWDIDECTSNLHDCDITDNKVCQNKINGFDCVCSEGYTETADQKCSKDIQKDDYGMIIGLSVGIPLGIVAVVAMGLSVYLCRRNSTTKRTYRNWNRRYTREERERTHAREEYVSTVHRHYPTPTPEGTAAYKSVSTWYSGSGSGEYRPYQDIDRQSSRNWIERSLALERGLTITRPKVDREESI